MIDSTLLTDLAILLGLLMSGPEADSAVPPPPRPNISVAG